jgi:hypothetical protein
VETGRLDKVRLSRERCLFDGGAGGVTVREEGIMALKSSGGAKTLGLATLPSLPGDGASDEAGEAPAGEGPLDLDLFNRRVGWIRSR